MLHVLIRGIDSERMRRRLFKTDDLKLEKAVRMCRNMEATTADLQMWSSKKEEEAAAGSSRKYQRLPSEEKHKTAKRNCARCSLRHAPNKCPAQGKTCYKCQKPNHFEQVYKSKEEAQMVD